MTEQDPGSEKESSKIDLVIRILREAEERFEETLKQQGQVLNRLDKKMDASIESTVFYLKELKELPAIRETLQTRNDEAFKIATGKKQVPLMIVVILLVLIGAQGFMSSFQNRDIEFTLPGGISFSSKIKEKTEKKQAPDGAAGAGIGLQEKTLSALK